MPIRPRTTGTCGFLQWQHRQGRADPLSDGSTTTHASRFHAKNLAGHDAGRAS
jgi:hypothetical protein